MSCPLVSCEKEYPILDIILSFVAYPLRYLLKLQGFYLKKDCEPEKKLYPFLNQIPVVYRLDLNSSYLI